MLVHFVYYMFKILIQNIYTFYKNQSVVSEFNKKNFSFIYNCPHKWKLNSLTKNKTFFKFSDILGTLKGINKFDHFTLFTFVIKIHMWTMPTYEQ